jgi:hypothetical protein
MQEFSIAFGRVSRATFSANPELKNQVSDLVNRAYYNIHGVALTTADQQWSAAIVAACLQLCLDARVRELNSRELLHLFENVIRISEEHLREARRHAAMASNVFYLKETALDATLVEHANAPDYASSTIMRMKMDHGGRLAPEDTDAA